MYHKSILFRQKDSFSLKPDHNFKILLVQVYPLEQTCLRSPLFTASNPFHIVFSTFFTVEDVIEAVIEII